MRIRMHKVTKKRQIVCKAMALLIAVCGCRKFAWRPGGGGVNPIVCLESSIESCASWTLQLLSSLEKSSGKGKKGCCHFGFEILPLLINWCDISRDCFSTKRHRKSTFSGISSLNLWGVVSLQKGLVFDDHSLKRKRADSNGRDGEQRPTAGLAGSFILTLWHVGIIVPHTRRVLTSSTSH